MVNMASDLGAHLRQTRTESGLSLQAVADSATISQAYLHKLETGHVHSPSPRVLQRVADALGLSYRGLMELAGYLDPDERDTTRQPRERPQTPQRPRTLKEEMVDTSDEPTNAKILGLLIAIRDELAQIQGSQQQLASQLEQLTKRQR